MEYFNAEQVAADYEKPEMQPDTLEDLITYTECARDTLLLIHNEVESCGGKNKHLVLGSLYGVFTQLTWVCDAMQRQVDKLPGDTLRRIAATSQNGITADRKAEEIKQ